MYICTSSRSYGSSLRQFLVKNSIGFLKCHDWKMVFSKLGIYHLRRAFIDRPRYRKWIFSFCLWGFNVHRRRFSRADTFLWEREIIVLLSEAEGLYPSKWCTSATHYLVHIPRGLRLRGPLLAWCMYGLERFGDYLMKLSKSRHKMKHVSIAKAYLLHELCSFLTFHDPSLYRSSKSGTYQNHMFSFSQAATPSSWQVSGHGGQGVRLSLDVLVELTALYNASDLAPAEFLRGSLSNYAHQVVGKIWCGVRYIEMYYRGYDEHLLGKSACCVVLPFPDHNIMHDYENTYDGQLYGILRNVLSHRATLHSQCPHVYFFHVQILNVRSSTTDVPLLEASGTGTCLWFSQASFDNNHLSQQFCLRNHDDPAVSQFYLIELN